MKELLEPIDQILSSAKNATRLSRLCEKLIHTFIAYEAQQARVREELIDFDSDDLYNGLYAITRRKAIKGRVRVHRQHGHIYLIKKDER